MDYRDKVVIVTGGTKGIGEGCVRVFINAGSSVVFCARHQDEGDQLTAELKGPGEAFFIKCDVTDTDEIKTLIDRLQDRTDEEIYKVRARVASSLQALVESISVVMGAQALVTDDGLPTDERGFIVQFKNGYWRSVHPRVSPDHDELEQSQLWHTDDVTWKPSTMN